jgi:hypothetical protein
LLAGKFGDDLKAVRPVMQKLARAYKPQEFARNAYRLYERIRPDISEGVKGWAPRANSTWG